ncbi:MAG: hypothetical protein ACYDEQ_01290 [Desulfocucumaceae bacterium]
MTIFTDVSLSTMTLGLPIYPLMGDKDTEDVINAVTRVINYYSL